MMAWTYAGGQDVEVGDKVYLGSDVGVVIGLINHPDFLNDPMNEDWGYLESGFFVEFPAMGLVFIDKADNSLKLITRQ